MGRNRDLGFRLVVAGVVAGDVAVAVHRYAEHELVEQLQQLLLHLREQALGQRHEARRIGNSNALWEPLG
ncbi:MAG: hypothetical protein ACK50F_06255, partial [Betaproteobacteria bacterium]